MGLYPTKDTKNPTTILDDLLLLLLSLIQPNLKKVNANIEEQSAIIIFVSEKLTASYSERKISVPKLTFVQLRC